MTLTENYLISSGYDYFENAAEDTLVFFVRDNQMPFPESSSADKDDESEAGQPDIMGNEQGESQNDDATTNFDTFKTAVPDANTGDEEWRAPVTTVAQKEETK